MKTNASDFFGLFDTFYFRFTYEYGKVFSHCAA